MSRENELEKLLKEARRIIRNSLSRGLYKDWDIRATSAIQAKATPSQGINTPHRRETNDAIQAGSS